MVFALIYVFLSTYFHRNVHENNRFFLRFLLTIWSQIPDLWTKIVMLALTVGSVRSSVGVGAIPRCLTEK